jgi:hypothetical protein
MAVGQWELRKVGKWVGYCVCLGRRIVSIELKSSIFYAYIKQADAIRGVLRVEFVLVYGLCMNES